jgi:hypothetical protein
MLLRVVESLSTSIDKAETAEFVFIVGFREVLDLLLDHHH